MCGLFISRKRKGIQMKHIPREFIDDLISRINIVEIINQRVPLKKKGHNYFGCCPFHNEKTASFSVNEKKQMFHCFGCGVSGTAISFLMDYDKFTFPEAIEELAQHQGLTIPYAQNSNFQESKNNNHYKRELFDLMGKITHFYQQQLTQSFAKNAQQYLDKRGLNETVIKNYQIGFSPNDWQATQNKIVTNEQERKLYDLAGMLVTNDNKRTYDRFRGRIMFPIRNRQGNVIGFGGRTIQVDDNVKYLNSPETPIFHKGQQLYGLFEALEANRNPEQLVVVEGYMDVISLAQYGVSYAVATLGTATTPEHIQLLFRATDKIIFCYDGDLAGKNAAWKALVTALPLLQDGKVVHFTFLPNNEDPDSYIRKEGLNQFENKLKNSMPLSEFLFEALLVDIDLGTSEGKSRFSAVIIPLLKQINAPYYLLSLKQELGRYLKISDLSYIEQLIQGDTKKIAIESPNINKDDKLKLTTIRVLLAILLQFPDIAKTMQIIDFKAQDKLFHLDEIVLFQEIFEYCQENDIQSTAQVLTHFQQEPFYSLLQKLEQHNFYQEEQEIPNFFKKTLAILYDDILKKRRDDLIEKGRITRLTEAEKGEIAAIILALSKKSTI